MSSDDEPLLLVDGPLDVWPGRPLCRSGLGALVVVGCSVGPIQGPDPPAWDVGPSSSPTGLLGKSALSEGPGKSSGKKGPPVLMSVPVLEGWLERIRLDPSLSVGYECEGGGRG